MKKKLALILTLVLCLTAGACGAGGTDGEAQQGTGSITNTEHMTIDGIFVDDSYRDKEESPLRLVYLFYTLTAGDSNLKIDSKYTRLTIGEANTYESEIIPGSCDYASSYYYGTYIQDVYVGESLKVAATFKIPEGDLAAGKSITLSDDQNPDAAEISMTTDDIQHVNGAEEVAKAADPEGYALDMERREEADAETTALVKSQLNGYRWDFYVNNTSYRIEFWADNNFKVTTALGGNSGTYSVRKGYVFCTYPDTGYMVDIPYEITDGTVDLDCVAGFDVNH